MASTESRLMVGALAGVTTFVPVGLPDKVIGLRVAEEEETQNPNLSQQGESAPKE